MIRNDKPLGHKNYGSIPHLTGSRRGPGDYGLGPAQAALATVKCPRDHEVIVQEKLDGSNVGVARVLTLAGDELVALTRSGLRADVSKFDHHRTFAGWVTRNEHRFRSVLNVGERLCGEWLAMAHGTIYDLSTRDPFVAFDVMSGSSRLPFDQFNARLNGGFTTPHVIHRGGAISVADAEALLGDRGHYGADRAEGLVYRVERDTPTGKAGERERRILFLAKYVRPDKQDGAYFQDGAKWQGHDVWNWRAD